MTIALNEMHPVDTLCEIRDNVRLLFMAISSMEQDPELKVLAGGLYDVERKIDVLMSVMEHSEIKQKLPEKLPKGVTFSEFVGKLPASA